MAKWKSKLIDKILNDKRPQDDEIKQNPSHQQPEYFRNVVPPLNNPTSLNQGFDGQPNNNFNHNMADVHNFQITGSFNGGPEAAPSFGQQPQPNMEQQGLHRNFNTLALVNFRNNFKIPKAISFEIKIEKLKQLLLVFFSFVIMTISSLFIGFWFSHVNINYVPHPLITIPLLIASLAVFLINIVEFFGLRREVNLYIERTLKGSLMPPNFIISNYRKIHGRRIIGNWVFGFAYVILGIITLVMYLISGQKLTFLVQSWTVQVPDLMQDAIALSIVLAIIFFIHMMSLVLFKKRKTNIVSYYGYEIINPTELETYKKKINRICLILAIAFVVIVFFAIAVPIWVIRRRKSKS